MLIVTIILKNVNSMTIEEMIQNGELSDKQPKKEAVVEESRIMDPSLFESLKAETPEIAKIDFEAPVEETKPTEDKKKSAAKILHNVQITCRCNLINQVLNTGYLVVL